MNNNKSFFASIGLLFTAAIWGFAFVVVKDSLEYIGSVYMVAIRFLIASVGMALLFLKRLKNSERSESRTYRQENTGECADCVLWQCRKLSP